MNPRDIEKAGWYALALAICALFWAILIRLAIKETGQ